MKTRWEDLTPEERFWSHTVRGLGCWLWNGAKNSRGYGRLKWRDAAGIFRADYAHRVAWKITNGPIPQALCVCHSCDIPLCVNPVHLWIGTKKDNTQDAMRKGRMRPPPPSSVRARGEAIGVSKLTPEAVASIRSSGASYRTLAARFGVSTPTIWHIKARKTWRHVP